VSSGDQDKTEQPTSHRLEEARKRGEVAKSADVSGSLVMIVFAATLALTAAGMAAAFSEATRRMIQLAGNSPPLDGAFAGWVSRVYAPAGQAMAPLVLALVVAAVLGNLLQTGPMFTTHPLKPDFKRMNPTNALRRIFSLRTLWELGKLTAKFSLLVLVGWAFAWKGRALVEAVVLSLPHRLGGMVLSTFVTVSIYVLLVLALVALTDLLFTRREFMRKMRMSRRELKDEVRRRDGDPAIKSKRRQQQRELLGKVRALARVSEADVVLTNPTHVAVALRYRPGETLGPVVVAKGAGFIAARIRALANRHRVSMVRVPSLARALYRECPLDATVAEAHYAALVPIYRTVWASRRSRA